MGSRQTVLDGSTAYTGPRPSPAQPVVVIRSDASFFTLGKDLAPASTPSGRLGNIQTPSPSLPLSRGRLFLVTQRNLGGTWESLPWETNQTNPHLRHLFIFVFREHKLRLKVVEPLRIELWLNNFDCQSQPVRTVIILQPGKNCYLASNKKGIQNV